jgi:hypothetical protein
LMISKQSAAQQERDVTPTKYALSGRLRRRPVSPDPPASNCDLIAGLECSQHNSYPSLPEIVAV